MINNYSLFVALALTVVIIPGPAVVLTVKNSLQYGFKVATANIIGNFIAMVMLASFSALGLGAIILASTAVFATIKLVGCGYLVYLGLKAWKTPQQNLPNLEAGRKKHRSSPAVLKEGFYVGIANPKAIAFFTALFPHFIDQGRAFLPQFLTLILTIEGISFCVLMLYACLAARTAPYLAKSSSRYPFNKLTGLSFISFGVALLYEE